MELLELKEYLKWLSYQNNIEKELLKEILSKKIYELNSVEAKLLSRHLKEIRLIRNIEKVLNGDRVVGLEYDLKNINLDDLINYKLSKEEIENANELINSNNINLDKLINNYDNLNIIDTYIVYKLRINKNKNFEFALFGKGK